jgi:hypothetical protein
MINLNNRMDYDGSEIHSRFAYKFLRDQVSPTGDVVIFRGKMNVTTNLIDQEDLLSKDFIFSDDAINIIWEIPGLCAFGAVAFQRLFNTYIGQILSGQMLKKPVEVDGDDLLVIDTFTDNEGNTREKGKASVSITYSSNNVALGHTGINIEAGKFAPVFAYSTKLTDDQVFEFARYVEGTFYEMTKDMFIATTKTICK